MPRQASAEPSHKELDRITTYTFAIAMSNPQYQQPGPVLRRPAFPHNGSPTLPHAGAYFLREGMGCRVPSDQHLLPPSPRPRLPPRPLLPRHPRLLLLQHHPQLPLLLHDMGHPHPLQPALAGRIGRVAGHSSAVLSAPQRRVSCV